MSGPKPPACRYANSTTFPVAAGVHLGGRESTYTMSVAVKATFALVPGRELTALGDQEGFRGEEFADPESIASELLHGNDLAMWKPHADLLLRGTCHAPGGAPVPVCEVGWRVGDWAKTLRVSGDRVWRPGLLFTSPGEAIPFSSMPLGWSRAAGGPDAPANPAGRASRGDLLPNIEYADRPAKHRSQAVEPAGFGPINRTWAPRSGKMGTYDKKHMARVHPRFPEDFDWSYFNEAPADQQLAHHLRGDEEVSFLNLHPQAPSWSTRLPGLRIRVFLADTDEQGVERIREAAMRLDTLSVDTDAGILALIWRGLVPVRSEDRGEITKFYTVSEPLSAEPRPAAEHIAALPDAPDLFQTKWEAGLVEIEAAKARTQAILDRYGLPGAVDKALADPGMTPAVLATFPFTPTGPLPASVGPEARKVMADAQADFVKWMAEFKRIGAEQGAAVPTPPKGRLAPMAQLAEFARTCEQIAKDAGKEVPPALKDLLAKIQANPKDPFGVSAKFAAMRSAGADLGGTPAAALADGAGVDDVMPRSASAPASPAPGALPPAAKAPAAPAVAGSLQEAMGAVTAEVGPEPVGYDGEALLGVLRSGTPFAGGNWAGGDFSGMDLTGVDFTGAILTRARFRGARLDRAVFVNVLAQDADFSGASGSGATFEESDLSRARFAGAELPEARFASASLAGAVFADARMPRCRISGCAMDAVDLRRADWTGATLESLALPSCPMDGLRAAGSSWSLVLCSECTLEDAVFDRAVLDSVVFSACRARRIRLVAADIRTLRVLNGSDLSEAVAVGARADRSTWLHAVLVQANFDDASLRGACLMDSWCERARFQRADLTQATLRRSRFAGADFQAANLFQAGFGLTDLQGASLVGANGYEADFTDARTTDTDLRLARLTRTSLHGRQ